MVGNLETGEVRDEPLPKILIQREFGGGTRTNTLEEAAVWLCHRLSDTWHVTMPTETDVRVVHEEGDRGFDRLHIVSPVDLIPAYQSFGRYEDGTYGWTMHHGSYHHNPVFDRGLGWIYLSRDDPSTLNFGVTSEHGFSEEELLRRMEEIPPKVNEFIGAILLDNPKPPYLHE